MPEMIPVTLTGGPRNGETVDVRMEAVDNGLLYLYPTRQSHTARVGFGPLVRYERCVVHGSCRCGNHPDGHDRVTWAWSPEGY